MPFTAPLFAGRQNEIVEADQETAMDRRLDQMRANPRGKWRIQDVEAVCATYGLRCSPPRGGGSHYKVAHPAVPEMLSIPFASDQVRVASQARPDGGRGFEGMMSPLSYPVVVRPLSEDEAGGYLATVPDLPGCMSDGETPEEAIVNVRDAILCCFEMAEEMNRPVPPPSAELKLAS